jgi:hypothetical protein
LSASRSSTPLGALSPSYELVMGDAWTGNVGRNRFTDESQEPRRLDAGRGPGGEGEIGDGRLDALRPPPSRPCRTAGTGTARSPGRTGRHQVLSHLPKGHIVLARVLSRVRFDTRLPRRRNNTLGGMSRAVTEGGSGSEMMRAVPSSSVVARLDAPRDVACFGSQVGTSTA